MAPQTCPHCAATIPDTQIEAGAAMVEFLCPACGGSLQPNHDGATATLIAPRTLGKFQLLDKVGAGGFGEVWRARDTELHRIVAVKIPHASSLAAKSNLERFYREARAAAQLRHPGIVTVYEVSLHDAVPVIVSDFIEGVTLRELVEVHKLSFREAAVLVAQVADALDYAHAMGLIHRDVKPANIMIEFPRGMSLSTPLDEFLGRTRSGGRDSFDTLTSSSVSGDVHASQSTTVGPRALILDFGLARRDDAEATLTVEGQILGTPAYMSPEQAAGHGHQVDRRGDIYGLGSVLYELICGRPPFQGSQAMIVHQVLRDEPPPPRKLNDKTPRDLQTICLKAMAKAVGGRYASARELADDLRCFLMGEPIRARAVRLPERVWRWSRRNPATASLVATVLLLLVVVTVTSSAFAIRLKEEKSVAVKARNEAVANAEAAERARQAEQAARRNADDNARVAVEQTDLALDSLSILVTKVQQRLTEEKGMDELRRDLLQTALDGLVRVVRSSDRSGYMDRAEASARLQMGHIMLRLGQPAEAMKHYERAHEVALALHEAEPNGDKARGNLAVIINTLGQLSLIREPAKAREHFLRAIELQEDLVSRPKGQDLTPAGTQRNLAGFYDSLGSANQRLGDAAAARDVFLKALRIRERLAVEGTPDAELQESLARSFKLLGDLSFSLSDAESALTYLQRSLNLRETIAAANPQLARYTRSLANAVAQVGDLHLRQRRDADALTSYTRSLELTQELVKSDPASVDYQRDLALMHYRIATALLRQGDSDSAREHYRNCLALRGEIARADANSPSKQIDLMIALARCGRTDDAAKLAAELQAKPTKDTNTPFQIGCCYAVCAATAGQSEPGSEPSGDSTVLRQTYASKAVESLRRAVARGYRDLPSLATDPDLDAIRGHPEYKLLVNEMTSPTR